MCLCWVRQCSAEDVKVVNLLLPLMFTSTPNVIIHFISQSGNIYGICTRHKSNNSHFKMSCCVHSAEFPRN